jgi:hypothetical protein
MHCEKTIWHGQVAADAMMKHPLQVLAIAWRGVKAEGEMAPEIALDQARSAQYVFDGQVQQRLSKTRANEAREKAVTAA